MSEPSAVPERPSALLPRRLAALFYDLWPALALWMLLSALFTLGFTVAGHGARENIAPFSALQWLLWLSCWVIAGLYATISWRRGGQTLGMRPWQLYLRGETGAPLRWSTLWLRYLGGTVSLLCGGLGFWWALVDRQKLTLHDRLSGTRLVRIPRGD
ncbi:hypothetical protein ARC78_10250 [Stenotrophomonas pictorum JCM 9942]|jgi:uncharacterized RDD family membrane protein YckC|uniref:RDD domain-containing protein n=1 Tax=Stenotrophomonas pictorum JCM 9942 TaxID=1236960 RepID=A0A0R0AAL4_9GAMM|nr:RDD family protein [Stenotrophomonas pictorum]KRG42048.1 hypothetical protein ARC78_10250 [Stenotrophomonas pictorum JCM 9942]